MLCSPYLLPDEQLTNGAFRFFEMLIFTRSDQFSAHWFIIRINKVVISSGGIV